MLMLYILEIQLNIIRIPFIRRSDVRSNLDISSGWAGVSGALFSSREAPLFFSSHSSQTAIASYTLFSHFYKQRNN